MFSNIQNKITISHKNQYVFHEVWLVTSVSWMTNNGNTLLVSKYSFKHISSTVDPYSNLNSKKIVICLRSILRTSKPNCISVWMISCSWKLLYSNIHHAIETLTEQLCYLYYYQSQLPADRRKVKSACFLWFAVYRAHDFHCTHVYKYIAFNRMFSASTDFVHLVRFCRLRVLANSQQSAIVAYALIGHIIVIFFFIKLRNATLIPHLIKS